jgi:hypothetical protein
MARLAPAVLRKFLRFIAINVFRLQAFKKVSFNEEEYSRPFRERQKKKGGNPGERRRLSSPGNLSRRPNPLENQADHPDERKRGRKPAHLEGEFGPFHGGRRSNLRERGVERNG